MPRSVAASAQNNFTGAVKTEFTGLNFPENAAIEADNCIFDRVGRVTRRLGIDLEINPTHANINRAGSAISTYLWRNVAGDGTVSLFVVQVGGTLYFYDVSEATSTVSGNRLATTITLSTYSPAGAASPVTSECQFADGNGYLYVFHPYLEPFYVSFDTAAETVAGTAITVQIRDFKGIEENIPDLDRPLTLTDSHLYNLGNQGWTSGYKLTSTTSLAIGTGSKAFTVSLASTATSIRAGDRIIAYSASGHGNAMFGIVASYSGTALTMTSQSITGSGTKTDWIIAQNPANIEIGWFDVFGNYPSNVDVWWRFKNSSDVFAPNTTINNLPKINTPAPKGHYILSAWSQDRATAASISGLASISTGGLRPSTGAFFQGRVFYAGVGYTGYNHNIYFSQIIEPGSTVQFGKCYQNSDPTSEDLFDLLPSDGGVIVIQGAGTIVKLFSIKGALLVFCTNGIWMVTGSQGIGFAATDYTVQKISSVKTLSATSFVEVLGLPYWWTADGIYTVQVDAQYGVRVDAIPITHTTIATLYDEIPLVSKQYARGYYHPTDYLIQWIYREETPSTIEENYSFNKVLNYNTITKGWYPWTVSDSTEEINGIVVLEGQGTTATVNNVQSDSGANQVVDASGNQVITYSLSGSIVAPSFKYLCSKVNGSSYDISFAEERDDDYVDWATISEVDFTSYFITGYAVHGDAQRKFQSNYILVYSDNVTATSYSIQGIWSFANTGASGQFTSRQKATQPQATDLDGELYDVSYRRYKIRGNGVALQLKFSSVSGSPFSIIGWSKWETQNQRP